MRTRRLSTPLRCFIALFAMYASVWSIALTVLILIALLYVCRLDARDAKRAGLPPKSSASGCHTPGS